MNLVVAPLLEVGARTGSSTDDPRAGIGIGALGDPMFTLQAGKQHGVGILGDIAHALTAEGADAREDGTGRGTPIIATCLTAREAKGPDSDVTTNLVVSALDTQQGGPDDNAAQGGHLIAFAWQAGGNNDSSGAFKDDGTTPCLPRSQTLAVAFAENQRGEVTTKPVADSLKVGGGKPGQGYPAALTTDAVRRLTPLECERLQGFPDNWTEGQSDSARYKQMGNSVAVPVFTWVLRRLEAVA